MRTLNGCCVVVIRKTRFTGKCSPQTFWGRNQVEVNLNVISITGHSFCSEIMYNTIKSSYKGASQSLFPSLHVIVTLSKFSAQIYTCCIGIHKQFMQMGER